jgi:hypothetical protein
MWRCIEPRNRLDRQLTVDFCQAEQVVAISGAAGEALEADDAAQACDQELDPVTLCAHRAFLDGVVVEWGQTAAQDVDHSCARLRS